LIRANDPRRITATIRPRSAEDPRTSAEHFAPAPAQPSKTAHPQQREEEEVKNFLTRAGLPRYTCPLFNYI